MGEFGMIEAKHEEHASSVQRISYLSVEYPLFLLFELSRLYEAFAMSCMI
jgi:hypothetical protein